MSLTRAIVYLWVLPTTCAGLLFLPFIRLSGGGYQIVDGVLELYGGIVSTLLTRYTLLEGGASAMTLGHVVIGRDRDALDWSRAHERVHVRQYERWGPFFIPAYLLCFLVLLLRGRTHPVGESQRLGEVPEFEGAGQLLDAVVFNQLPFR